MANGNRLPIFTLAQTLQFDVLRRAEGRMLTGAAMKFLNQDGRGLLSARSRSAVEVS